MIFIIGVLVFILYIIGSSSILRSVKEQPIEARRLRKERSDNRPMPHHYQRLASGLVIQLSAIIAAMILQASHYTPKFTLFLPASLVLSLVISIYATWRSGRENMYDKLINIPASLVARFGPVNLLARALSGRRLLDPRHIDTVDELLSRLETQIKQKKGVITEDEYHKIRNLLRGDARTVASVAHTLAAVPSIKISVRLTPKTVDDISNSAFHGSCIVKDQAGEIIGVCTPGVLASVLMTGGNLDDRFIEPVVSMLETETISSARKIMLKNSGSIAVLTSSKNKPTGILSLHDLLMP